MNEKFSKFAIAPALSLIRQLLSKINTIKELYLSELRRDFLASIGITYAVFRIAKSRLRHFGEFC
jgi:hypothetical protein